MRDVCDGASRCTEFTRLLKVAGIAQEQTVFTGAAVCALIAAVLALVLFRRAPTRASRPATCCAQQADRWLLPAVDDFDDLLAANRDFAATSTWRGFDGIAHAGVAIVTCMDSRIDPLRMIGLKPGDAKIFRNPGGRVTPQALEALVLGVHLLNVDRILVIPHTRCAMASTPRPSCARGSAPPPAWTPPGSPSTSSTTRPPPSPRTSHRCARTR